jgi:glycosyltransferase involved in cell wall biosynthesis
VPAAASRRRLVIVAPWGERNGGAEMMLWSFLRRLADTSLEAHVVFLQPGPFEREVAALGVPTHVVAAGRLRSPGAFGRTVRRLRALLRRLEAEVVVSWATKAQLYAAPAALLARRGVPLVWLQHGVTRGDLLDRVATCLPATAICCSSDAAASAQAQLRPGRRLFVINPGVDPAPPDPRPRALQRRALGLPDDRFVAGVVGRWQPGKGQDRFLLALAELRRRGLDVHGVLVGGDAFGLSPAFADGVRAMVGELGLDDRVTLTGQVPDATCYIRTFDVLVCPSTTESFGIALVEAMLAGVPVVSTAKGGPASFIEPGVSGVMVESRSPEAIADGVEALLVDPARRSRMAAAGRAEAARFDSRSMTRRVDEMLRELTA